MQEENVENKVSESQEEKNWDDLLKQARSSKDEGNKSYASGNFDEAIELYTRAIELMIQEVKEETREPEPTQSSTNTNVTNQDSNQTSETTSPTTDSKVEPVDRLKETPKRLSPLQMKHPSQYHSEIAIFYGNRAACYLYKEFYEDTIKDCSDAIELDSKYVKAYLRRAAANEKSNKFNNSMRDYQKAYELDSSLKMAKEAAQRLEPQAKEEQEREKAEMMAKLKDLGNSFLGLFGLSTDNFQFNQDPNTGGYSVNFKR